VNILVNSDNDLHGIFQDEGMKEAFADYPELLCIDATYKLLELCLPLYNMLAEDGNGQRRLCFPAAGGDRSFPLVAVAGVFKDQNPAWESVHVLMADKDITEWEVLASSFPGAELLICLSYVPFIST